MRKPIFTLFACVALFAIAPASALAKHHHKRHHARTHHTRIKRFGVLDTTGSTTLPSTPTTPTSDTAGTVTSFTNGLLTITLNGGTTTVSGMVTPDTELNCTSASAPQMQGDDAGPVGGGDNGGSTTGTTTPGGTTTGDDNGDNGGSTTGTTTPGGTTTGDDNGDNGGSTTGDDNGDNNNGGGGGDEGNSQTCTTASLTPNTVVQGAELKITSAGAVFDQVDLITP
jgi:hypothetical protein